MHYGCCALAGQSGGAFAFALTFLLNFFCQEKKLKTYYSKEKMLKELPNDEVCDATKVEQDY